MRIRTYAITLSIVFLSIGCDSSAPSVTSTVSQGPHHGMMIPLGDDKSFVELLNEPEVLDRRNPQPTAIVAYFLQADKTPLSPAPSEVSVALDTGSGGRGGRGRTANSAAPSSIQLKAEPKGDDPAGSSRFASPTGPYSLDDVRGTLSAKVGGQDFSIPFARTR